MEITLDWACRMISIATGDRGERERNTEEHWCIKCSFFRKLASPLNGAVFFTHTKSAHLLEFTKPSSGVIHPSPCFQAQKLYHAVLKKESLKWAKSIAQNLAPKLSNLVLRFTSRSQPLFILQVQFCFPFQLVVPFALLVF